MWTWHKGPLSSKLKAPVLTWHFALWTPLQISASLQDGPAAWPSPAAVTQRDSHLPMGTWLTRSRGRIQTGLCQHWTSSTSQGADASVLIPTVASLFLPAPSGVGRGHRLLWSSASTQSEHKMCHLPVACFPSHCHHCLVGSETRDPGTMTPSRGIC